MSRDRAIEIDEDVARVLRFMEGNIAAQRLQQVARYLPEVAALIWSADRCAGLYREPILPPQSNARESVLVEKCAGDGSGAVAGTDVRK